MPYSCPISTPQINTTVPRGFFATGTYTREGTANLIIRCTVMDSGGNVLKVRDSPTLGIISPGDWVVVFQPTDFGQNYMNAQMTADMLDGTTVLVSAGVDPFNIANPSPPPPPPPPSDESQ